MSVVLRHSVLFDSPHGLKPIGLLCPWDSPGKSTGASSHSFLQGIFPTQGLNPSLLHFRWILYHMNHQGSPTWCVPSITSSVHGRDPMRCASFVFYLKTKEADIRRKKHSQATLAEPDSNPSVRITLHRVYVPPLLYPSLCWWTCRLLPRPGCRKQRCHESWGTCVFLTCGFLCVYAQEWNCQVMWHRELYLMHWGDLKGKETPKGRRYRHTCGWFIFLYGRH